MTLRAKLPLVLFSVLLLILFQGCGNNDSATDGATITVNPPSKSAAIAAETHFDFTVTARYKDGTPYPNAVLYISGSFATPRTTPRYTFYYLAGGATVTGNYPVDSPYTVQTNDSGNYSFSIVVPSSVGGLPNSFTDNIDIFSGSAYGTVALSITGS